MNPEENIMGYVLEDIHYLLFINFGFECFTFLCDSVVSSLILVLAYRLVCVQCDFKNSNALFKSLTFSTMVEKRTGN